MAALAQLSMGEPDPGCQGQHRAAGAQGSSACGSRSQAQGEAMRGRRRASGWELIPSLCRRFVDSMSLSNPHFSLF